MKYVFPLYYYRSHFTFFEWATVPPEIKMKLQDVPENDHNNVTIDTATRITYMHVILPIRIFEGTIFKLKKKKVATLPKVFFSKSKWSLQSVHLSCFIL